MSYTSDAPYIQKITEVLEDWDKEEVFFRTRKIFEDQRTAILASRALNRHLKKSGGRLGGFSVKQNGDNRLKHGILWRATKMPAQKSIILKNMKL